MKWQLAINVAREVGGLWRGCELAKRKATPKKEHLKNRTLRELKILILSSIALTFLVALVYYAREPWDKVISIPMVILLAIVIFIVVRLDRRLS
jgi:hypothetical protein